MRFEKFTLKAQEVIETSQELAERFGHQQIEPEHLVRAILDQAFVEAEQMKDEFVSLEHILLAVTTDPNPEDKYQALERFSRDLTA